MQARTGLSRFEEGLREFGEQLVTAEENPDFRDSDTIKNSRGWHVAGKKRNFLGGDIRSN